MKIGELAKSSGCSVQTIRYYEKEGLISAPTRSEGNFRLYDNDTLETLLFIKHCRSLDLTLKEIKQLIQLQSLPTHDCEQVNLMIEEHLNLVESRITELQDLRTTLEELKYRCISPTTIEECGIVEELAKKASRRR